MIIRVHINKVNLKKQDKPWSLLTSKGCFHADAVTFKVPVVAVSEFQRKDNPKCFIKCQGRILWEGSTAVIVS